MKRTIFFTLICFFFTTAAFAQTDNAKPYYFHKINLLWGGELYILKATKLDHSGLPSVKFVLSKGKDSKDFEMVSILPSERTIAIFHSQLSALLTQFNLDTSGISAAGRKIITDISNHIADSGQNQSLTTQERNDMKSLIESAINQSSVNTRKLKSEFRDLISKLNNSDSIYLAGELNNANIIVAANDKSSLDDLKLLAGGYFIEFYQKSIVEEIQPPVVGTLYSNRSISAYSSKDWDCRNLCKEIFLEGGKKKRRECKKNCKSELASLIDYDQKITKANAEYVLTLQKALKDKGHDPGGLDNLMGAKTKKALIKYIKEKKDSILSFNLSSNSETILYNLDDSIATSLGVDTLRNNYRSLLFERGKKKLISEVYLRSEVEEFNIDSIAIKFENEQVFDVKVTCYPSESGQESIVFQNRIPIPYSTKLNVSNDKHRYRLYATDKGKYRGYYVFWDEILHNDYKLLNKTENYSPKDQEFTLKPGEKKVIKKEKVTQIVNARVYTDLIGLNSVNQNGLIQTEISHRHFFNTKVHQIKNSYTYYGFFNSTTPKIIISKLESNNKHLMLKTNPIDTIITNNITRVFIARLFANTIDVYRYASWTSGADINIFHLGLPKIQSTIYLNTGIYVRHTPMQLPTLPDSTSFEKLTDLEVDEDEKFGINTLAFSPEISWVVSPHSQFRVSYSAKFTSLVHFSKDLDLSFKTEEYEKSKLFFRSSFILDLRFEAAVKLSKEANGELFFRSSFNFLPRNPAQNYLQVQLGYSFDIFSRKDELEKSEEL